MNKEINEQDFAERSGYLRKNILEMINEAGSGHSGGSLSCIDILNVLYNYKLRHDPTNPLWNGRDRFIMSKGHASPALYAVLADCGYFSKEEFHSFRKINGLLQGHVSKDVPGVELSTGSLGQGLSVAAGIALAGKMKREKFNVYVLLGDGEIQEGQIWESEMTAHQYNLNNLCVILDSNGLQENGLIEELMKEEPIRDKIKSFGWNYFDINGHDFEEIKIALDEFENTKSRPTFIRARTIKGKGVSFMENNPKWHGKAPSNEELKTALKELGF
ncbi:MAG: transketolase [Elusimicrobiota bacterium]